MFLSDQDRSQQNIGYESQGQSDQPGSRQKPEHSHDSGDEDRKDPRSIESTGEPAGSFRAFRVEIVEVVFSLPYDPVVRQHDAENRAEKEE